MMRTPEQIIGYDACGQLVFEGYEVSPHPQCWFVIYDDGTWAGGFQHKDKALEQVEAYGGQVVPGKWFNTEMEVET